MSFNSKFDSKVELVLDCKNVLGEGPVWCRREERLYWTDIEARRLWSYDVQGGAGAQRALRSRAGSLAVRASGGLLVAYEAELVGLDPATGDERTIAGVENTPPQTRLNDGRCDRFGRFVVGEFDYRGEGRGSAYRLDVDGSLHFLFNGLNSANSTCFSPDGRIMYFTDSPQKVIWAFDYDPDSGNPSSRRVFCELDDRAGLPDGSVVDSDGCLWNAEWGAGRLVRYTPAGKIDRVIATPCDNPTCPAFGGADYRTLFITSARSGLSEEQLAAAPHSGGLFALALPVAGLPEETFAG